MDAISHRARPLSASISNIESNLTKRLKKQRARPIARTWRKYFGALAWAIGIATAGSGMMVVSCSGVFVGMIFLMSMNGPHGSIPFFTGIAIGVFIVAISLVLAYYSLRTLRAAREVASILPATNYNVSLLPDAETLVRGSEPGAFDSSGELMRPAAGGETQAEHLLRPTC